MYYKVLVVAKSYVCFIAMQRCPWQNELIPNALSILISRITSAYFTPGSYLHMCIWSDQKLSAILFACTLTVQCTVRLTSPATDTHASHGSHGRGGSFEQISNQKWPMMRCQDTNYNTPQEFENSTSESLLPPPTSPPPHSRQGWGAGATAFQRDLNHNIYIGLSTPALPQHRGHFPL